MYREEYIVANNQLVMHGYSPGEITVTQHNHQPLSISTYVRNVVLSSYLKKVYITTDDYATSQTIMHVHTLKFT